MIYGECNMEERKLIKVTVEFSNGDKEYIEGDDVDNWKKATTNALTLDLSHGGYAQNLLKDIVWKKV